MEQIHNLVTGCLVPGNVQEGEDSDDEGGDDDMTWVGYKDVGELGNGKSLVPFEKPKRAKGELIDLQTGRSRGVAGGFHITDPWWQVTILRTKKSKEKLLEPKDYFALCYRLRDDERRFKDGVVHLFLSKLQDTLTEYDEDTRTKVKIAPWFSPARIQFERFLQDRDLYGDLDLLNIEERLETYTSSFPEEDQTASSSQVRFKKAILLSAEYHLVTVGEEHPELMHYIPQLFPGNFTRIVSLQPEKLESLKAVLLEEPGLLAFKPIVSKECGILGCETSYEALSKSGMIPKVPQDVRDAILMYEYIKKETKENGHTYVHFSRILDVQGPVIELFEEALEFLNKNKVTKTLVENGERNVFLMVLWKAENNIAGGLSSLIKEDEKQPWKLKVDWESEKFESIRQDNDQLRAARLIASKPVVAISGKGGCGKTYVVTKVITAAKAKRQKQTADANLKNGLNGDTSTSCIGDKGDDSYELMGDNPEENEECPEKIQLLLTAPTGKAANLLGKRAKSPSYTLHQVIYSYRNQNSDMPWKHKDVNTLVVDECSLVSVATFSFLIQLLQDEAQLKRVVLLGDVRQLPSIEPGNFLNDTFTSLARIGCAVELRNNHRAESTRIVDNATRISKKMYPEFHPEQFSLLKLPPSIPSASGDDYTAQDISMKVMQLLKHDALKDHVTSQFISFTRRVCDSINDLCCKNYSDHRTQEHGKNVFRTGDKICCSKNGYVNLYERHHGIMTCQSQVSESTKKEEESEGGVERTVLCDEDTSLLGNPGDQSMLNGSLNTAAGASKQKQEGAKNINQIRLCNGEIFYILDELEAKDDSGKLKTFLQLSDKDSQKEFIFWVEKRQIKKACKLKHAWARTIHTFQGSETDNVVYIVGSRSWRQNWQHVYTAVTRGRKSVFIIGREDILRNAIKRSEIKRQTSLRKQLVEKLQKNKDFNTTEVMQTSVLNTTAFQANSTAPSVISKKGSHSSSHVIAPPVSRDQHKQPMITEFTTAVGNTTMNNTLLVRDVLSSLASEHDDDTWSSDIEEIESDESQSLFTNIKQPSAKGGTNSENMNIPVAMETTNGGQTNQIEKNQIELNRLDKERTNDIDWDNDKNSRLDISSDKEHDEETMEDKMEDTDTDSDPESDNSQSLISPPTTRARACVKAMEQDVGKKMEKSKVLKSKKEEMGHNKASALDNTNNTCMEEKSFTAIKANNNRSKLSLAKGKMPLKFLGDQGTRTPLSLSRGGGKYRYSIQDVSSPITPVISRSNFSPNVTGAQTTSSPVTDVSSGTQSHIRSGMSPLTSDYKECIPESKSVLSKSKLLDHTNQNSLSPPNFHRDVDKGRRLSELNDIKEPMSNESAQWSEVDESDLLMAVDESILQQQQVGNLSLVNHQTVNGMTKQMLGIMKDHRKSLNSTNMSVNSQWSEVDDDLYMSLELEDINNMSVGNHDNKHTKINKLISPDEKQVVADVFENNSDISPGYKRIFSGSGAEKERHQEEDNADIFVPDSPPSPSILETPPKKLKLSQSSNQGNDTWSSEVSPLKNSLSKLKF